MTIILNGRVKDSFLHQLTLVCIWMCRTSPTLDPIIAHYKALNYCPSMAINQLCGNSLNALLIQRLLWLPNNSKPTYLPDHPKREDAPDGGKGDSSNWNGWRHPEKFKNPPTSETVTMVRSCQNITIYNKSNKESLYVDPHGMMEKNGQPSISSRLCTNNDDVPTSWLVFTERIPKYWLVKKREKLVRYFVH